MRDGIGANQGQSHARSRDGLYPLGADTGSRRHAYGITDTASAEHCDGVSGGTLVAHSGANAWVSEPQRREQRQSLSACSDVQGSNAKRLHLAGGWGVTARFENQRTHLEAPIRPGLVSGR